MRAHNDEVRLSILYVLLLRWEELSSFANEHSIVWPTPGGSSLAGRNATLSVFESIYKDLGVTSLSESGHNLSWFEKAVLGGPNKRLQMSANDVNLYTHRRPVPHQSVAEFVA